MSNAEDIAWDQLHANHLPHDFTCKACKQEATITHGDQLARDADKRPNYGDREKIYGVCPHCKEPNPVFKGILLFPYSITLYNALWNNLKDVNESRGRELTDRELLAEMSAKTEWMRLALTSKEYQTKDVIFDSSDDDDNFSIGLMFLIFCVCGIILHFTGGF